MVVNSSTISAKFQFIPDIDNVTANSSLANPDPFKFSHGLTGVDQPSNYVFVHILIATALIPASLALALRIITSIRNDKQRVTAIGYKQQSDNWKLESYACWGSIKWCFLYAPVWTTGHSRPQFLISIVYVFSNIAYCSASLPLWSQPRPQDLAAFRGRCGTLAAYNLVLAVLFALRNNPLIWILHVSFDTFNKFHQWTARLVVCEATAHVLAFAYNAYNVTYDGHGGWDSIIWVLRHSFAFRMGLASFAAFILLALHSIEPLRHAFYETFLTIHRIGIIIAITGVYFHLARHALPQLPWVYLIIAFLILELIARTFRILYYNVSGRQPFWTSVALEALPGEATRVTFFLPCSWNANPGSHVHVYLPRIALWSSHPFSIAWTHSSGYTLLDPEKLPSNITDINVDGGPSTVSCIIRARTGMTRTLYDLAQRTESNMVSLSGAIEGPYGGYHSLDSYGTVVLFAGGVGITHPLSFVRRLLAGHNNKSAATQKILLVWCIPHIEAMDWIEPWLEELAAMANFHNIVRIRLHVSRMSPVDLRTRSLPPYLDIHGQRCDVQEVLDAEVLAQVGAMVVTVCGPSGFNNSVTEAVRRRVGIRSIDFMEEAFTY
tara:strand:+ start:9402 stop:11222 length:1821 start_codon:yes stop_codon:yes gene_type:complete